MWVRYNMKYIGKPIFVDAFQLGIDKIPEWFVDCLKSDSLNISLNVFGPRKIQVDIDDPDSMVTMMAEYGDYIVRGASGNIYPCNRDNFEQSFDKVEE